METAQIRCSFTRQYVKVILLPVSEDGPSSCRPIICPVCMKVHSIRRRELEIRPTG